MLSTGADVGDGVCREGVLRFSKSIWRWEKIIESAKRFSSRSFVPFASFG